MAKRRAVGPTIVGALLVLGGIVGGGSALFSLAAGDRPVEYMRTQLRAELDRLPTGMEPGDYSAAYMAQLRQDLDQKLNGLAQMMTSPAARMALIGQGVLSLLGIIAGLALLRRARWAPDMVTAVAVGAAIFGLWWTFLSPTAGLQERFQALMLDLAGPAEEAAQLTSTIEFSKVAGQAAAVALALGWNGFLIWFMRQPVVRQECVRK